MKTYLQYSKYDNSFAIFKDHEYKQCIGNYCEGEDGFVHIYIYKNEYTDFKDEIKFKFNLKSLNETDSVRKEQYLLHVNKYWELMNKYVNGLDCEGHSPSYTYAEYNPVTRKYTVHFVYSNGEVRDLYPDNIKNSLYISIMNYGDIFKAMEKAYNSYIEEVKK